MIIWNSNSRRGYFAICIAVLTLLFAAGCGTTSSLVLKPSDQNTNFLQYNSLAIQTSSTDGVVVSETTQDRIKEQIKAEINKGSCPNRFRDISLNSVPPAPEVLLLHIKFTKYDEGNRFARAMLAGLGSMKIYSSVEVKDAQSGNIICSGEAGTTFAWGGIYGAMTGIEDVEKDFAKEVSRGFGEMLGLLPAAKE